MGYYNDEYYLDNPKGQEAGYEPDAPYWEPQTYNPPTPSATQPWEPATYPTTPTPYTGGYPQYPTSTALVPQTPTTTSNYGPTTYDDGTWIYMQDYLGDWKPVGRSEGGAKQADQDKSKYQQQLDLMKQEYQYKMQLAQQSGQDDTWYKQQLIEIQRQQLAADTSKWQAQLDLQKQQQLAQLAAQPKSWLEYAALQNQPPAIQPWMMPLMPQEYGYRGVTPSPIGQPGQSMGEGAVMPSMPPSPFGQPGISIGEGGVTPTPIGQPGISIPEGVPSGGYTPSPIGQPGQSIMGGIGSLIPGWTPENMKNMPSLLTPSQQLWARMGPTAQQQYYGYQQAQQGITPEEQQWRLWSQAPPSGGNRGFVQRR